MSGRAARKHAESCPFHGYPEVAFGCAQCWALLSRRRSRKVHRAYRRATMRRKG